MILPTPGEPAAPAPRPWPRPVRLLVALAAAAAATVLGGAIGGVAYSLLWPLRHSCGVVGCWDFLAGVSVGGVAAALVCLPLFAWRALHPKPPRPPG